MQRVALCIVLLGLLVGSAVSLDTVSSFSFDAVAAKNRPVTKVITLLKDMLKQLEKEAQEDEDIYDKMACWCETNDKEKTQAIEDAETRITDLTSKVEEMTATSARLGTEIQNLGKELAENQASLDAATAIRQKQLAEFRSEEKDLLESVNALKSAIIVLSKHHSNGLLQTAATLQHELHHHAALLEGVLTHADRRMIDSFMQAPEDYFDASSTFMQGPAYAPQSGQIFGILKEMKETFESNLSASQKEEAHNQQGYEDLKAAKEDQIAALQQRVETKTQQLADTDQKRAQAKQDIEDTRNSLSADEQFLMMLKEKCQMTDKEWEERQKTRQSEMQAVSEALAVLSSDDAHDTFTRTFNPAFLEEQDTVHSQRRSQASKMLSAVAKELQSPRLAALATKIRLDAFTRVKKAIDDMVAQLLKEKEDEIKHKDFCVDDFNKNELQTERKEREKEVLLVKIDDLSLTIKQLGDSIQGLKAEIAEMQVQLKRAGEDRQKQNKEFQTVVADQRATQQLLEKALSVLNKFYVQKVAGAAFAQKQEPAGPPPPPGFKTYENSGASGGVLALLHQILNDAKTLETETLRAEEDAQKAYEDFVKDTNRSIEEKSKDVINKSESKAKAEGDLVQTESDKESTMLELEKLSNYNAELHGSCDFVLKNFELRQTARDEEVEALKQAKAILSGADFQEFLQN